MAGTIDHEPEAIDHASAPPAVNVNRLIHEKSPYLLQHAHNPVDWYPWGEEAFDRAKREDKPVFLSIGYSSCHWCHVMAHESFEDEDVARILNRDFISVKVDREERPDVDEIYMTAVQLMTNSGGWPLSVFLTPERRPFFGGTYFPKDELHGRVGFKKLLGALLETYKDKREDVELTAARLSDAVRHSLSRHEAREDTRLDDKPIANALDELWDSFDGRSAGFGGAPKFPPHGALRLIFGEQAHSPKRSYVDLATHTLDAMAAGGIHDHIGGGFHRYSTDSVWLVPHFEKMLYDNAQLLRAYTDGYLATNNPEYKRVAEDIVRWVSREMTSPQGAFYAALDADSEGEEGKYYVWTRGELNAILGKKEAEIIARTFGFEDKGNFRDEASGGRTGANIPHLRMPIAKRAAEFGVDAESLASRVADAKLSLLCARAKRTPPGLDDKVLAGWNGMMISALAYSGRKLSESGYVAAATRAATFVLEKMSKDGRLFRTYGGDEARLNAYLDDYAFMADGLLELHEATGDERWLSEARSLIDTMMLHFADPVAGGFYFTSDDHEELLARSKDAFDRAIPSGNGVAADVLLRLGRLTGEGKYAEAGRTTLQAFASSIESAPRATISLLVALREYIHFSGDARAASMRVTAEAFLSSARVPLDGEAEVAVRITIDDGWHINSAEPEAEYLEATVVKIREDVSVSLIEVVYPPPSPPKRKLSSDPEPVYTGTVWIRGRVQPKRDAPVGRIVVPLEISVQPCSDGECLAPRVLSLPLELVITEPGATASKRHAEVFAHLDAGE